METVGLDHRTSELLKKTISFHTAGLAVCHAFERERTVAIKMAKEAIRMNPANPKALAAFIMSVFFPGTLIEYLSGFRKKFWGITG